MHINGESITVEVFFDADTNVNHVGNLRILGILICKIIPLLNVFVIKSSLELKNFFGEGVTITRTVAK